MELRGRVEEFLTAASPDKFCDECLTVDMRLTVPVLDTLERLAADGCFTREIGVCSICGETRLTIWSHAHS